MSFKFTGYCEALVLQINTLYMWKEIPQFQIRYLEYFTSFHGKLEVDRVMSTNFYLTSFLTIESTRVNGDNSEIIWS